MKLLVILNDPPYGTERPYNGNGLRLADSLAKRDSVEVFGEAQAFSDEALVEGARRSSLEEVTEWTISADMVVSF